MRTCSDIRLHPPRRRPLPAAKKADSSCLLDSSSDSCPLAVLCDSDAWEVPDDVIERRQLAEVQRGGIDVVPDIHSLFAQLSNGVVKVGIHVPQPVERLICRSDEAAVVLGSHKHVGAASACVASHCAAFRRSHQVLRNCQRERKIPIANRKDALSLSKASQLVLTPLMRGFLLLNRLFVALIARVGGQQRLLERHAASFSKLALLLFLPAFAPLEAARRQGRGLRLPASIQLAQARLRSLVRNGVGTGLSHHLVAAGHAAAQDTREGVPVHQNGRC
eukprot:scaffold7066_cov253-Pinguiococcus_pyrenoidosus.AAC.39